MKKNKENIDNNRYKKVEKGNFTYYVVLGTFIVAVLGALFLLYKTFDISKWTTWFGIIWVIVYLFFIYCWLDGGKWDKIENIFGPLIEDFGLSLSIIFPIVGIIYSIYQLCMNDNSNNWLGVLIFMSLFLMFDIIMIKAEIMTFNFVDWIKEKREKKKKKTSR